MLLLQQLSQKQKQRRGTRGKSGAFFHLTLVRECNRGALIIASLIEAFACSVAGRSQIGGMVSDGSQMGGTGRLAQKGLRSQIVSDGSQMSGMVSNGEVSGLGLGFA